MDFIGARNAYPPVCHKREYFFLSPYPQPKREMELNDGANDTLAYHTVGKEGSIEYFKAVIGEDR